MNIVSVIEYLNKNYGYDLSASYYQHIQEWQAWWCGFYKPFHEFRENAGTKILKRKLYTMFMAKTVCEDWASILLNEKTMIVVDDKSSSEFLMGPEDEQGTGGVLGANSFWLKANELIEKAFMSGTGAIVVKLDNMQVDGESVKGDIETKIRLEYLPADCIIPLTVVSGKVTEAAFVSEVILKGKKYTYLEMHTREGKGYRVTNKFFKDENGTLTPAEPPEGIIETFTTLEDVPLFALVSPNIVNNIDPNAGLGMSIYANAIDCLMGVDLAFNNFCRDFKLGGKKVFINQSLTTQDENGIVITPDDVAQQLFMTMGDDDANLDGEKLIHEFNPSLRVAENRDGVQAQLDYLSFKCGFGTKHYQFNSGSIVTATQYSGDKQELIQHAAKHYIAVEALLKSIVHTILWVGKNVLNQNVNPDAKVNVNFDDSYIIDKESERLRDREEIRDGIQQKWEYRMKWYGEDEATAKQNIGTELTNDEWLNFGGGS